MHALRHSILAFTALIVIPSAYAKDGQPSWEAKDISVVETVPGENNITDTRVEIGANGDARINVNVRDGNSHTKGSILLIAGHWMLTQGFTPTEGAEIDLMDVANLNAQLVLKLLAFALPKGPPIPGLPQRVNYSDSANPIEVATSSASGQYDAPWEVDGTVTVESLSAPAVYRLTFAFTNQGLPVTLNLAGRVADSATLVFFPDSMKLRGWAVHKIGPSQERHPDGVTLDFAARPNAPKATTVGELRRLTN